MLILSIEVLPKQTESLRSRLRACEAGGKHKAWGASPRIDNKNSTEPAKRATAHGHKDCHPFHGFGAVFIIDPGACAPGFMLPPASQAKEPTLANSGGERVHCFK